MSPAPSPLPRLRARPRVHVKTRRVRGPPTCTRAHRPMSTLFPVRLPSTPLPGRHGRTQGVLLSSSLHRTTPVRPSSGLFLTVALPGLHLSSWVGASPTPPVPRKLHPSRHQGLLSDRPYPWVKGHVHRLSTTVGASDILSPVPRFCF